MVERPREAQLVHFYGMKERRLVCGFVDAHINWTLDPSAVDCPRCRSLLAVPPEPRAEPQRLHSA